MEYPNKIFVFEQEKTIVWDKEKFKVSRLVMVAAVNETVAKNYVYEKLGFVSNPTWIMDAVYKTIYDQKGNKSNIQAKILHNFVQSTLIK